MRERKKKEKMKRKVKRERPMYIFIYKKHNISYRYKGPRSGVSQSFMYNRRSNSNRLFVSLLRSRLPLGTVGAEGKSRVHPVMFFFSPPCMCLCACVLVFRCGCRRGGPFLTLR